MQDTYSSINTIANSYHSHGVPVDSDGVAGVHVKYISKDGKERTIDLARARIAIPLGRVLVEQRRFKQKLSRVCDDSFVFLEASGYMKTLAADAASYIEAASRCTPTCQGLRA